MSGTRGRILVIRGGAIGDFILTLPVLAALRRHFPEAHLEVLGYGHIAQLALAAGMVDAVRSIEARALAGFFARNGPLEEELRNYFAGFDLAISYLYDPDEIFRANIARCSRVQFIAGPHRPDERSRLHATEVFLQPLERVAIYGADPVPRLGIGAVGSEGFRVGAHPGSGSERKNWPEARWAVFLRKLMVGTAAGVLLMGGEAEGDRLERLSAEVPMKRLQLARNVPLVELAQRLRSCAAFVGHDSGITHLAAALEVPTCVLWGESEETVWHPRGERVTVVRHPLGLAGIEVGQVLDALRRWL
ncbi:MAG: glycosyltransferase family 9 protein [Verrucomicrobia bacterium]|nr:glycosyltransferase family 9 protein [Verrucomicrobiota bacterium]